jgi:hypothetical protein
VLGLIYLDNYSSTASKLKAVYDVDAEKLESLQTNDLLYVPGIMSAKRRNTIVYIS